VHNFGHKSGPPGGVAGNLVARHSDGKLARNARVGTGHAAAIPGGVLLLGEGWWYVAFVLVPLAAGTSLYAAWLSRHLLSDRRLKLLSVLTYLFAATILLDWVAGVFG